jgi:hypothetical protein
LLSGIPFVTFTLLSSGEDNADISSLKILKSFRLLRFFKLVRLFKFKGMIKNVDKDVVDVIEVGLFACAALHVQTRFSLNLTQTQPCSIHHGSRQDFLQESTTRKILLLTNITVKLGFVIHICACIYVMVGRAGSQKGIDNW